MMVCLAFTLRKLLPDLHVMPPPMKREPDTSLSSFRGRFQHNVSAASSYPLLLRVRSMSWILRSPHCVRIDDAGPPVKCFFDCKTP